MAQLNDSERIALVVLACVHGAVDPGDARQLLAAGLPPGTSFVQWLSTHANRDQVLEAVAHEIRLEYVDFQAPRNPFQLDDAVLAKVDIDVLKRHTALPLVNTDTGQVVVATANPLDVDLTDYLRAKLPDARMALASARAITAKLVFLEAEGMDARGALTADGDDDASGLRTDLPTQAQGRSAPLEWIDTTLERALVEDASDVHFTWDVKKRLHLKLRVDGMLRPLPVPLKKTEMREAIGALLAKCDGIDSTNLREPLDATFSFEAAGRRIDVRLAMLPQINGPTIVLRLLDPQSVKGSLDRRGIFHEHVSALRHAVAQSQGMVIVTGPTGSGKSTTLYTLLGEVDATQRNVHTVEDPVEYRLDNINQTPIRHDLGERSITFARALRSILRLDPDVILVGEMRDLETAKVGLDAAITGHLVLSTLHANDAIQTFARLIEMDVPPYLVAEAISASVSQRLVRTLHSCAVPRPVSDGERAQLARYGFESLAQVHEPVGCDGCANSGYRGRTSVMEVLAPNRAIREAVSSRASVGELYETALRTGFRPMMADGMRLVAEGQTTVVEIQRVLVDTEASA